MSAPYFQRKSVPVNTVQNNVFNKYWSRINFRNENCNTKNMRILMLTSERQSLLRQATSLEQLTCSSITPLVVDEIEKLRGCLSSPSFKQAVYASTFSSSLSLVTYFIHYFRNYIFYLRLLLIFTLFSFCCFLRSHFICTYWFHFLLSLFISLCSSQKRWKPTTRNWNQQIDKECF